MSDGAFSLRAFHTEDAAAFAALNRRWIDELFAMEESDIRQLETPQESILDQGGYIAIAEKDGQVIGTGAVLTASHQPDDGRSWMEIIKMATDPAAQGHGVGGAVLDALIAYARSKGADGLWLETNDKLEAATALYCKKGFRTLGPDQAWTTPYARCNLQMIREL